MRGFEIFAAMLGGGAVLAGMLFLLAPRPHDDAANASNDTRRAASSAVAAPASVQQRQDAAAADAAPSLSAQSQLDVAHKNCLAEMRAGGALPAPNQRSRCDAYADLARSLQPASAALPSTSASPPAYRTAPTPPVAVTPAAEAEAEAFVDQCQWAGEGSVHDRECRAREKRRLERACRNAQDAFDRASGAYRDALRISQRSICKAFDHYEIVR